MQRRPQAEPGGPAPASVRLTRRGRVVVGLGVLAAVLLVAAGAGYAYLRSVGFLGKSDPGRLVEVVIPEGSSSSDIGLLLERHGIIKDAFGFRLAAYFDDRTRRIQAGQYELPTGLTAPDALDALLGSGPILEFVTVTFPEGSWLVDFAEVLDEQTSISGEKFLELTTGGGMPSDLRPEGIDTMEGLLFPSTYQLVEKDTAKSVARRLARELEEQLAEIDLSAAEAAGFDAYEVVIIASMVEAEARLDEERPKVARVIYNRLEQGMPLGIDATVLYALGEHKEVLTRSDLAVDSPYNTRIVAGLPPTPIGAPGRASLEAAANPAAGPWLYYVLADCEGHHAFSESYDEFLRNKAAYQTLQC